MNFNDMGLEARIDTQEVKINDDIMLTVRDYLPADEKGEFIQYIVNSALDSRTGCFSPLRVEVYFALAICHWYGGIDFDETMEAGKTYDALDTNGVISSITEAIDQSELNYIRQLTEETVADIARYNNSAAGVIQLMTNNTNDLNAQVENVISQIRDQMDPETLKLLTQNMVGND